MKHPLEARLNPSSILTSSGCGIPVELNGIIYPHEWELLGFHSKIQAKRIFDMEDTSMSNFQQKVLI